MHSWFLTFSPIVLLLPFLKGPWESQAPPSDMPGASRLYFSTSVGSELHTDSMEMDEVLVACTRGFSLSASLSLPGSLEHPHPTCWPHAFLISE